MSKFISKNELSLFAYDDCRIIDFSKNEDGFVFTLEALIVKENNSQNSNFTRSYADEAVLTLKGVSINKITIAGYKEYDADDNLVNEVADRVVNAMEYDSILGKLKNNFLYRVIEKTYDEATPRFVYDFEVEVDNGEEVVDLREDTYVIEIAFTEAIVSWDRYLNRVQ